MRGTPWLVGLVCVLLVVVPTSLYVEAQEPETRGRHAPPEASPTARLQEWTGRSALHLTGACVDERATCVGGLTREDGSFFLPAAAEGGSVVVSWRPLNDSLRELRVRVAGVEVAGESPLRIDFIGLGAGQHPVRIEPARPVAGNYDQTADWVATFAVTAPPDTVTTRGASSYRTLAGCILGTCDPVTTMASDPIIVPWDARGELVADWDRRDGAMRLSLSGTDRVVQGMPPLTMSLDGLAPGEYRIEARPSLLEGPLADVSVGWVATLARQT